MKKMMICLCCLLLWGCQVAPEQSAQESVTVKNDLIIKDAQDGDGNEEGYYLFIFIFNILKMKMN